MNCLSCNHEIPAEFFAVWSRTTDTYRGLFNCPQCGASHLRQLMGHTTKGRPLYEVRLWGHPATTRRVMSSPKSMVQGPRSEAVQGP